MSKNTCVRFVLLNGPRKYLSYFEGDVIYVLNSLSFQMQVVITLVSIIVQWSLLSSGYKEYLKKFDGK